MDTSAWMTLSGVRSSCEASAVNSRSRRCARAIGERARIPTTKDAPYINASKIAPNISSALTNESRIRSTSARLSPATSHPESNDTARTPNVEWPMTNDPLPATHLLLGKRGAPAVNPGARAVRGHLPYEDRCVDVVEVSVPIGRHATDGAFGLPAVLHRERQALGQADVHLRGQVVDQGEVEDQRDDDVTAHADHRGHHRDPAGANPVGTLRRHGATTR